ncbi:MAG TPA: HAMP domain-containing sensor histidine kinase [Frateuria sp.]|uniref:sensor histidine kinase n=1 Tax=Frateuria sp. TaxID=2211372 RepID=UPI002D7F8EA0|nr:HAMP domain-containing sensor histidine kinase [Frateuria sp.]HET6804487.1 HAMP domain-containing sensor histidine kinase [Frateuria sp.]
MLTPGTIPTPHRRGSRLRQLRRRLDNAMFTRARYSQPMMPVMCLLGGLFMPLYWYLWTYLLPQPYSNLGLHVAGCAVLLPLALQRWWPRRCKPWLPAYWYAAITFVLPFFFGYLMLRNGGAIAWMGAHLFSIFITMMLFDLASFALIYSFGSALAALAFQLGPHAAWPVHALLQYAPLLVLTLILGPLASLSQKFGDQAKVKALIGASNNIAHELRTPLGSVQMAGRAIGRYLPNLLESHRVAERAGLPVAALRGPHLQALQRGITVIEHEVNHANTVIDMLLMAAKPMGKLQMAPLQARACVTQALARYPYASQAERERVQLATGPTDFTILGSEPLLTHVLFNLLRNALFHTGRAGKGEIRVSLDSDASGHCIRVRDTGPGIPPDVLPRIFNRFYSHSDGRDGTGLGIGLAFSQSAVERMGGRISCRSRWGEYTEFFVAFPPYVPSGQGFSA